ncbi:GPI mannosyltransferase 2 [Jimgerdemannia flammicorona]|uniref:GPI mannosyltransferase 2 n=1 Tax=Jimgerdemannia flammicorona TaxID=994334 RepID=A0A433QGT1_9FUNG|nr:GPI mannosyltransferase 2 [Jimgerdemannia flammicorona]
MSNHEPPVPPPAFLSSSRPTLNTVLYLATLSRLLTWLLAYLCNLFVDDYDSASDTILPPLSSFPLVNYFARPALAVILRWDAFYFLHIAEEGYVYEQEHAFFPLVPALARVVARIVWLLSDRYAILIAGALIANISFVLAAGALYRLTYAIYPTQPRLAFLTAVAYIITPSGMFMTAFYTESPFALLTFWGMYEWARGRNWQAAVAWGMAGFVRSNAVVYIGFFVWDGTVMWFKDRRLYGFQSMISHLFTTICCSLMVLCGFVGFQWYGYQEYCVDFTPVRPWCNATAPLLYNWSTCCHGKGKPYALLTTQTPYRNNGFLRYYEIKQIPNFLFAAPMIGLSFVGIYSYARHDWRRFLTLGLRSCLNSTTTSPYHTNARLLPFVYLWLVLVLYCVTNMHVQVITRFFSSVPGVYWFVAEVWSGAQEKHGWADKVMTRYFVLYAMVGVILFANFFPPA